jgi:hypothetical protein
MIRPVSAEPRKQAVSKQATVSGKRCCFRPGGQRLPLTSYLKKPRPPKANSGGNAIGLTTLLSAFAGLAAVLAFAAVFGSFATALAFARVLSFAAVVPGFAATLALTIVLTFAPVFTFVSIN